MLRGIRAERGEEEADALVCDSARGSRGPRRARGSRLPLRGRGRSAGCADGARGRLHGLRVRVLQRAVDGRAERVARLAVPRGRDLHRRREPDVRERRAHLRLGRLRARRRLEPDPDLRRARGAVRERLARALHGRERAEPGRLRGRRRDRARDGDRPPRRQPDLLRPRVVRAQERGVHAGRASRSSRRGSASSTRAGTSPASTAAPPRPGATCRRSPGRRRARTTSGSPTGTGTRASSATRT